MVSVDRNIIVSIISEYGQQRCVLQYILKAKSNPNSLLPSSVIINIGHISVGLFCLNCISYNFVRMNLILIAVHFINNTSGFLLRLQDKKVVFATCFIKNRCVFCLEIQYLHFCLGTSQEIDENSCNLESFHIYNI